MFDEFDALYSAREEFNEEVGIRMRVFERENRLTEMDILADYVMQVADLVVCLLLEQADQFF